MITVIVLTLSNWNEVMLHTMHHMGGWSSMYFVLLIVIGDLVLLNLIMCEVLEQFHQVSIPCCSWACCSMHNHRCAC